MRAAYTILLGNPQLAIPVDRRQAETRFKVWWELVGSAVEHAAGLAGQPVRFADLFRANDAADEGVGALEQVLATLGKAFPNGRAFAAKDLTTGSTFGLPNGSDVAPAESQQGNFDEMPTSGQMRDDFMDALATASMRPFPPHQSNPSPKMVAKRLQVLVGRPVDVNGQLVRLHDRMDRDTKVKTYAVQPVRQQPA
jgi:hypothetical protein